MKNWFDFIIQCIYYFELGFLLAYFYPMMFYKLNVLLENEYPTEIDFEDIKLKSEDEEGRRTYLISEEDLVDVDVIEE